MKSDLFWIRGRWRGRLAVAARPRGGDWLADEAGGWRLAGLDLVVSLLEEEEAAQLGLTEEARAVESEGIHFISFPIPDRGVPASASAAFSLMSTITEALESGKNVAVHCRQGLGRSGLMAAGVLVRSGLDPEQAIEIVSAARGQTVPETADQRSWVQRLPSGPAVVTH